MRMRNPKDKNEILNSCNFYVDENLFNNNHPIELEIGMGKGDFLLQKALNNPEINYIGVEKYSSVACVAIKKIRDYNLPNLKILIMDIMEVPEYLYHQIDTIYLNFSDPWPKVRHAKRRLTHENFLQLYDKLFKGNAHLIMKTDNDDLFAFSEESLINYGYKIVKKSLDLHQETWLNYMTEYEQKFSKQGIKIKFIEVEKESK